MAVKLKLPDYDPFENKNSIDVELLVGMLYGGKCIGYEKLVVGAAAVQLTIPAGAKIAIMVVEANAGAVDANKVIHYREDGVNPNNSTGMLLGDTWTTEVKGAVNLAAFRAISKDGLNHTIHIQYYGNE